MLLPSIVRFTHRSLAYALFALVLIQPARGDAGSAGSWNRYLGQSNIVECVNGGENAFHGSVGVYGADAKLLSQIPLVLEPKQSGHLLLDAVTRPDTYGTFEVSGADNSVSCWTMVYRNNRGKMDYAFSLKASGASAGVVGGIYNSFNPSPVLRVPVSNWLSIENRSTAPFSARVELYSAAGQFERQLAVTELAVRGRVDIGLGHAEGERVGLYRIVPAQLSQRYSAQLSRYAANGSGFDFAFVVKSEAGKPLPLAVTGSTMADQINWGEIANLSEAPQIVRLKILAADGAMLGEREVSLEPFAQHHIYLNAYLGANTTGVLQAECVSCSDPKILLQSMFYGGQNGRTRWAYASTANAFDGAETASLSVNTFLDAANWLKVASVTAAPFTLRMKLFRVDGAPIETRYSQFSVAGARDIPLHEFGANQIGTVELSGAEGSQYTAEVLRVFSPLSPKTIMRVEGTAVSNGGVTPTPTPAPTSAPTPTPTAGPTPTATPGPTPDPTPSPTAEPTATPQPTREPFPEPVAVPKPDFVLDFTSNAFLDSTQASVVFQRDSAASVFNSAGDLVQVSANVPRIDYDSFLCAASNTDVVQEPKCPRRLKGLLLEEQRTNLIPRSEDFSQAPANASAAARELYWSIEGSAQRVLKSASAPSGGSTALISVDGTPAAYSIVANLPVASPIAFSMYVKDMHPAVAYAAGAPIAPLAFRVLLTDQAGKVRRTGVIDARKQTVDAGDFQSADPVIGVIWGGVIPNTPEWHRVWFHADQIPAGKYKVSIEPLPAASAHAGGKLEIWGVQLEAGAFPTSYIRSAGAVQTRAADKASFKPTGSWYSSTSGNVLVEADAAFATLNPAAYLVAMNSAAGRQVLMLYKDSFSHVLQGSISASYNSGSQTALDREPFRVSMGYVALSNGVQLRTVVNGSRFIMPPLVQGTMPSPLNEIQIGQSGDPGIKRHLNGHIRRIEYRKYHLNTAEQTALSALGRQSSALGTIADGWQRNEALSDECNDPLFPSSAKWGVQAGGKDEPHIESRRWRENVDQVSYSGTMYCRFRTEYDAPGRPGWTTGSVWTKRAQKYGYFESRYKTNGFLKTGESVSYRLNNAFWLFSTSSERARDPSKIDFEIDVNEGKFPHQVDASTHLHRDIVVSAGKKSHPIEHLRWSDPDGQSAANAFHTFGFEWDVQELRWYVDGVMIRRSPNYFAHRDAFVYFSTAILKSATGETPPAGLNGKHVLVDYIRSYRKAN